LAQDPEEVAQEAIKLRDEGGFTALKLRLGREIPRMISEPSTLFGSRSAMRFNTASIYALHRCHAIADLGLEWIEEPIVTTILTASRGSLPN
jgi:mandelate racemase